MNELGMKERALIAVVVMVVLYAIAAATWFLCRIVLAQGVAGLQQGQDHLRQRMQVDFGEERVDRSL